MLKILHIVPTYAPAYRYGGPIASVHALNKGLAAMGHAVTVFTTNVNGPEDLKVPLERSQMMDGVEVRYFPVTCLRSWFYSPAMSRTLTKQIGDFDIVHITSVFLHASEIGSHHAKKADKPYLISPRGSLMREPLALRGSLKKKAYLALMERGNLAGAAGIHFTSDAEAREYVEAGFPAKKTFVVPNAVEAPLMEKDEPTGNSPRFVALGRITEKKGFDTLIPAFKEVIKEIPNATLVIAGNDERGYERKVREMVEHQGLPQGSVEFVGMVEGAAKAKLLQSATAFVLPSYSENFGMAPIEALAHGTAVVITREVGIADEVDKEGVGVVTDKDERQFAQAMVKVAKTEMVGKPMGSRGPRFVAERFSPEKVAREMEKAYTELISDYHVQ